MTDSLRMAQNCENLITIHWSAELDTVPVLCVKNVTKTGIYGNDWSAISGLLLIGLVDGFVLFHIYDYISKTIDMFLMFGLMIYVNKIQKQISISLVCTPYGTRHEFLVMLCLCIQKKCSHIGNRTNCVMCQYVVTKAGCVLSDCMCSF